MLHVTFADGGNQTQAACASSKYPSITPLPLDDRLLGTDPWDYVLASWDYVLAHWDYVLAHWDYELASRNGWKSPKDSHFWLLDGVRLGLESVKSSLVGLRLDVGLESLAVDEVFTEMERDALKSMLQNTPYNAKVQITD